MPRLTRTLRPCAGALLALLLTWLCLAGPAAQAPVRAGVRLEPASARRTPLVRLAERCNPGVVLITAHKQGEHGPRKSLGTGVIVDPRGYVVTNHHVIADAEKIELTLQGGTTLTARVHKDLPKLDLAILRVKCKRPLVALRLARSGDVLAGETVLAIGNPLGLGRSVSAGIVAATGRTVEVDGVTLKDLIQHTAPINPGNSGGPLLNVDGEVLGINCATAPGAQCVGLAISAATVRRVLAKYLPAKGGK